MKILDATVDAIAMRKYWSSGHPNHPTVRRFRELPETPTPDEVDAAFEYLGWNNRVKRLFTCDECGAVVPRLVEIGEPPTSSDSRTIEVCPACLFNALRLVDGE